jgi:hypothetical protein
MCLQKIPVSTYTSRSVGRYCRHTPQMYRTEILPRLHYAIATVRHKYHTISVRCKPSIKIRNLKSVKDNLKIYNQLMFF